jgi:glycosyltransferase involved in cell wall biosynthesis
MNETICILPQKIGRGGPGSFHSRFAKVLLERGYSITHDALDPANSAILVIGGTKEIPTLWRAKRNGVRIVQRLNGMNWVHRKTNTGLRHFLRAEVNNLILATIRSMSDQIIYQSEFSRDWWLRVRGKTRVGDCVIYNGVDLNQFSPRGEGTPPSDRVRILLVEGNLGNGYEQGFHSAVLMAQLLDQRLPQPVELVVAGSAPDSFKQLYAESGIPICWKGLVKREEIPLLDRSAHMLFSSDINAACPNSVIEALACGLPVIGYDTGSLAELVTGEAGAIAHYGGDPWQLQKPDVHTLADAAQSVFLNQTACRKAARAWAEEAFNIQHIADQYLKVLLP